MRADGAGLTLGVRAVNDGQGNAMVSKDSALGTILTQYVSSYQLFSLSLLHSPSPCP